MPRRALIVGISRYTHSHALPGAAKDAWRLHRLLAKDPTFGTDNWRILGGRPLTDVTDPFDESRIGGNSAEVTVAEVRGQLEALFQPNAGGEALFYFTGHAKQSPYGTQLQAYDGDVITIDALVRLVRRSRARSVTIILDCCYAGDLADPFEIDPHDLVEGFTVLASTQSEQPAEASFGGGLFTGILLDGLEGAAADMSGRITAVGLYTHALNALAASDQTPTLKAYVTTQPPLRTIAPSLAPEHLDRIDEIFRSSDSRLGLTWAHEGDEADHGFVSRGSGYIEFGGSERQRELDLLKLYRDHRLVRSDSGRDFYWLCKHEQETKEAGTVSLTPLGRFYWSIARKKRA